LLGCQERVDLPASFVEDAHDLLALVRPRGHDHLSDGGEQVARCVAQRPPARYGLGRELFPGGGPGRKFRCNAAALFGQRKLPAPAAAARLRFDQAFVFEHL
jgi:hypothetical protein